MPHNVQQSKVAASRIQRGFITRGEFNRYLGLQAAETSPVKDSLEKKLFQAEFDDDRALDFVSVIRARYPWGRKLKFEIQRNEVSAIVDFNAVGGADLGEIIYEQLKSDASFFRQVCRTLQARR